MIVLKKKAFASLLVASFALFSCTQCTTPDQPENPPKTEPGKTDPEPKPEKPGAGDYLLLFPDLTGVSKTSWEAGDQIYFHGNYAPNAQVITLKAGDISEGGKKATVHLDESLMEFQCAPDGIYAAYPAQAVIKGDSLIDTDSQYSDWNQILLQAYLDKDHFSFRNLTAVMKFTVSGNYDSYALASVEREGIRVTGYSADLTSQREVIGSFTTDGYPFRDGAVVSDGSTVNYIYLPGGKTFKKGYTIYFGKDGVFNKVYTMEEATTIKPGDVLDLGDISTSLSDYNGPAPKMPEMGKRTTYTVKFNELSGLCLSTDGSFLWAVDDNGPLGRLSFEGEVLQKISMSGEHEAVTIDPATGDLLIGNEEPVSIYRVTGPDYSKRAKLFTIAGTSSFGNAGLEGLTYYKDGLVLAGMQTGSYLFCCDLATGEVKWKKNMRDIFPAITEIADLCYDPLTDWLWILDSEARKFFAMTGDAETMLGSYSVKGTDNPEALCIDHVRSCVWVGDDYGSTSYLYRYDFTGLDDAIIPVQ